MPELPEVETVKRGLERLIIGRVITDVSFDTPKLFPNDPSEVSQFLIGATVKQIDRRAKVLLIHLSTEYTLVSHLKMTGQLVFVGTLPATQALADLHQTNEIRFGAGHPNDSLINTLPDRSTHITYTFGDGSHLYFNDQRKFGWMRLIPTVEVPAIDFMKKVGPEPLDPSFTAIAFSTRLDKRPKSLIKATLLDQTVVAGIGNIYADESLYGAKIHPETRTAQVSPAKRRALFKALQAVLTLSIEKGGSTDKNYVNAEGKRGSYISFAQVFRREGQPCYRCGTTIIKTRVVGRGTHTCPHCQKIVR
jgi:formamidopyrimidine-DNA glycosylase